VIVGDLISRHDETPAEADPLLRLVLRGGKRLGAGRATLEEAREHACRERERLPESLRSLDQAAVPYTVEISAALKRDLESYRKQFEDRPVRVVKISKLAH
jgi:hypothetical protein